MRIAATARFIDTDPPDPARSVHMGAAHRHPQPTCQTSAERPMLPSEIHNEFQMCTPSRENSVSITPDIIAFPESSSGLVDDPMRSTCGPGILVCDRIPGLKEIGGLLPIEERPPQIVARSEVMRARQTNGGLLSPFEYF